MSQELFRLSAEQLKDGLQAKEFSSKEVVLSLKERIQEMEGSVNAFLTLDLEEAVKEAEAVDRERLQGKALPGLAGVPIAVKDNISTEGLRTTCASKMLENYVPIFDATVVSRLKEARMPIIGKCNMDEFAFGSSTENSAYGVTRNPWDVERVPGGSSGGSAACVAALEAPWSLGSDTGGSIRQPAALCGVVGYKPTYGLVSRYGLVAFASSLDQIGPLARTVYDAAVLLDLIAGNDPMDATTIPDQDSGYASQAKEGPQGRFKVGIIKELTEEGLDPEIRDGFNKALAQLESIGGECQEVSLPSLKYALATYYLVAPSEASSNLSRFDAVRYGFRDQDTQDVTEMYERSRGKGFGQEAKRRIMLGTYALSAGYYDAFYGKALKMRTLIRREFQAAFKDCGVLVSPTTPTTAFRIGEKSTDPLQMYLSDICTIPVNLAGLPAISLPSGLSQGLPVGFQLMGPPQSDGHLLAIAHGLEQAMEGIGSP